MYALILFPIVVLPYFLNFSGLVYLAPAVLLSSYYFYISYKLLKEEDPATEKKLATKLFGYSILFLFMIFALVLIDKII